FPLVAAVQVPFFEPLALSVGAEVELWLFVMLAAWFWMLYLRTNRIAFAALNAGSLFLASACRYEAWLFILAFLPLQLVTFSARITGAWAPLSTLVSVSSVFFFPLYQKFPPHQPPTILPLSYRGLRQRWRGKSIGATRSFRRPLESCLSRSRPLACLEL